MAGPFVVAKYDARMARREFQVLRVLEPALRMKAQADSNSRGRKDFICREFSWRKEKRKTAYWGMQGNPETGDSEGQGGEWILLLEGGDAFQMQTDVS
jgi:hypothetical protein